MNMKWNVPHHPTKTFWTEYQLMGIKNQSHLGTTMTQETASNWTYVGKSGVSSNKTNIAKVFSSKNQSNMLSFKRQFWNSLRYNIFLRIRVFSALHHIPGWWRPTTRQETETGMDVSLSKQSKNKIKINLKHMFSLWQFWPWPSA